MGLLDQLFGGGTPAPVVEAQPTQVPQLSMGAQLNGIPAETQAPPPKTPEELQQRKSQWDVFIEQIKADPNVQMAMLRMGTNLMQPVAPGQTAAGHLGKSLDDSVSYLGGLREAERARKNQERELTLKEQKGAADIAHTGASTKATEQATAQGAQSFTPKLKALQLELKKLEAEESTWTPEQAQKAVQLKNDLAQAQIDQARSHAAMYDAVAGKNQTTGTKAQSMKLDDGTVVTTTTNSKGTFYSRFVPPRFNSAEEARAAAEKVVQKKTPWFFGKPGYEGTAEQEINRLTSEWTKPGVFHYDANSKPISSLPSDEAPTVVGTEPPRKLSTRDKKLQGTGTLEPGTVADSNDNEAILRDTLVDTIRQLGKAKPGSPQYQGLLDAKTEIEAKLQASAKYGTNQLVQGPDGVAVDTPAKPTAPAVIKVERGADGKLTTGGKPATTPVAAAPKVDASQSALLAEGKKNSGKPVGAPDEYKNERVLEAQQLTAAKIKELDRTTARKYYNDYAGELSASQKRALMARFS